MKYLIIILLFTSCRVCYTKARYEKDIKGSYHYIEKKIPENNFVTNGLQGITRCDTLALNLKTTK